MYDSTKDLLRREVRRLRCEIDKQQKHVETRRQDLSYAEDKLDTLCVTLSETLADLGEPVEAETPPQPLGYALAT